VESIIVDIFSVAHIKNIGCALDDDNHGKWPLPSSPNIRARQSIQITILSGSSLIEKH
jgi:hypothetical protein